MLPRRLFTKIFASHLVVVIALFAAVAVYVDSSFRRVYLDQLRTDLTETAALVGERLPADDWSSTAVPSVTLPHGPLQRASTRVSIIRPNGEVLADTYQDSKKMENHLTREEVQTALTGAVGSSIRFSHTVNAEMLYVAVPIFNGPELLGVVRAARPIQTVHRELTEMRKPLLLGGIVIVLLAALVSYFLSSLISAPIEQMKVAAARFVEGDYATKLSVPRTEELGALARALNRVGARINEKLREITRQRNELDAVLSSMAEGVVAVDSDERIISMNQAAEKLFNVRFSDLRGRPLQEGIRSSDFEKLAKEVLSTGVTSQRDLVVYRDGDRLLEAHGTVLLDSIDRPLGALIVMNDVTHLRRLEKMRRDFVANVSHELKTPVTSIRGFIETLLDGAMENPDERLRFLTIIRRQADRLQKIIDDLLSLSQIEQSGERGGLRLELARVSEVVESAKRVCQQRALEKDIALEHDTPDDIIGYLNPSLLEQALVNLIDNAVKYSETGTTVRIVARPLGDELVITVHDEGPGIPKTQWDRVFERFYRVDEGRSRKEGGTGLGLAIVKHIAHVHGGRAAVESVIGRGSSFSLYLRRPPGTQGAATGKIEGL